MGYDIAAGTRVLGHRKGPIVVGGSGRVSSREVHFELIPFGAGRRGCPGIAFATAVNELALAKWVKEVSFDLPNGERKEDLDMSETIGTTVHRKLPLLVYATSHNRLRFLKVYCIHTTAYILITQKLLVFFFFFFIIVKQKK